MRAKDSTSFNSLLGTFTICYVFKQLLVAFVTRVVRTSDTFFNCQSGNYMKVRM